MIKNDLEREEPLLVNTEPEANNFMTSRALFFQRKLYDKVSFSSSYLKMNKPKDLWYEKMLYGRSDIDGRAIHISENNLKQLQVPTQQPLYCVNFVADAFLELSKEIESLNVRKILKQDSDYSRIQPQKAWNSTHQIYHTIMSDVLYTRFTRFINKFKLEKQITGFESFVNVFVKFVDTECPRLPFTRSKSVRSNLSDPTTSGLVIEIASASHSEDKAKVSQFLNDPNFPLFNQIAMRYGFTLDKHAPWRLIADIGSPAMKPYMEKYGVSKENIIGKYYYKTHLLDLEALKSYIIEFYNSYVSEKPEVVQSKFMASKSGIEIKTEKITRMVMEKEQVEKVFDEQYWLRMYIFIRAREENKKWNQLQFEKVVRNAFYYHEGFGKDVALEYINSQCKTSSVSNRKQRDYSFINTVSLI